MAAVAAPLPHEATDIEAGRRFSMRIWVLDVYGNVIPDPRAAASADSLLRVEPLAESLPDGDHAHATPTPIGESWRADRRGASQGPSQYHMSARPGALRVEAVEVVASARDTKVLLPGSPVHATRVLVEGYLAGHQHVAILRKPPHP